MKELLLTEAFSLSKSSALYTKRELFAISTDLMPATPLGCKDIWPGCSLTSLATRPTCLRAFEGEFYNDI